MELDLSPKSPRKTKNAWCGKALGVRLSGSPKSSVLLDYDFSDDFSPSRLKTIKTETDRGGMSGMGSFKVIVEQAEKINERFTAYKSDKKVKKSLLSKKSEVSAEELVGEFEKLIQVVEKWRRGFSEEGQRQKTGMVSDKTVESDKYRDAKLRACDDLVRGANIALAQLKRFELEASDEDFGELSRQLGVLTPGMGNGSLSRERVEEGRNLDGLMLTQVCGVNYPKTGSSEVGLVKAPGGGIAYAFKSIAHESDQSGLPKGGGAVRELMMSRLCEKVKGDIDLDFKWPKTSMAKLPDKSGKAQLGVLIDGIPGEELEDDANFMEADEKAIARSLALLEKVPPSEIQQLALCNLAFGQHDIKWDNCMVQEGEDGHSVAPFDGGAAFPDLNLFMDTCNKGGEPGAALLKYGKTPLEVMHEGKKTTMDQVPMDPALVKKFLAMDEMALYKSAGSDLDDLTSDGLKPDELGMDRGLEIMVKSIQGLKLILKSNPKITFGEFISKYKTEVMDPLADEFRDEWEKQVRAEYTLLQSEHDDMLPVHGDETSATTLRNNYLRPEAMSYLQRILKLGGVEFLRKIEVRCPFGPALSFKAAWTNMVVSKTPIDVKERYPELFTK